MKIGPSTLLSCSIAAVLLPSLCGAQVVPIKANPVENIGIDQRLGSQVPLDLHFRDERGTDVALRQFFGVRPVILMLVFYRCHQMCAVELDAMIAAVAKLRSKQLGLDYDVLCVSIDPQEGPKDAQVKRDAVLSGLKKEDHPYRDSGWQFLTGDLNSLNQLATSVGFRYAYDAKTDRVNHPGGIMILTPKGIVSQYMYGATYPSIPLRDSIALAAKSGIGKKADVFLFGCIVMDRVSHRLSVNIMSMVRILCILTVVGIGFGIVKMNRQSKADGVGRARRAASQR